MSSGRGERFRVPNTVRTVVRVEHGRIGLVEAAGAGGFDSAARPGNGIVSAIDGGLVVFTARERGDADFRVQVLPEAPTHAIIGAFEDVVELSYRARAGSADVVTPGGEPLARAVSFPGPGPVRARVHRNVGEQSGLPAEHYVVQLWQAPEAPEQVHRTAAGVAAARAAGPERVHLWIGSPRVRWSRIAGVLVA